MYGGLKKAFRNEQQVRTLVYKVLCEGIKNHKQCFYIVEEKKLEIFGCERRPDSVIKAK